MGISLEKKRRQTFFAKATKVVTAALHKIALFWGHFRMAVSQQL
jgi:hypothetical protein